MIYLAFLLMIVGCLAAVAYLFLPFFWFFIGAFGVMLGCIPTLMIIYLIAPRIFYYKVRIFEDRDEGAYVEHDFRARKVKGKDEYEYLETPTGTRFKFSDLKYFFSGIQGQLFGDLYRGAGAGKESQLFPIEFELSKKEKSRFRKKIIPMDQRAWFSNNRVLGYIKEATKIPIDVKLQALQMMATLGIVMIIAVVMILGPTWYEESLDLIRQEASKKLQLYDQVLKQMEEHKPILCQYEIVNPATPATPGKQPEAPPG